jgi:hypothetical protein
MAAWRRGWLKPSKSLLLLFGVRKEGLLVLLGTKVQGKVY